MSRLAASHGLAPRIAVTGHSNPVSLKAMKSEDWEDETQVDALAQLPMACLLTVNVADHVAGRVYQVAQDSALAGLSARGWAALLAVEVGL